MRSLNDFSPEVSLNTIGKSCVTYHCYCYCTVNSSVACWNVRGRGSERRGVTQYLHRYLSVGFEFETKLGM